MGGWRFGARWRGHSSSHLALRLLEGQSVHLVQKLILHFIRPFMLLTLVEACFPLLAAASGSGLAGQPTRDIGGLEASW